MKKINPDYLIRLSGRWQYSGVGLRFIRHPAMEDNGRDVCGFSGRDGRRCHFERLAPGRYSRRRDCPRIRLRDGWRACVRNHYCTGA